MKVLAKLQLTLPREENKGNGLIILSVLNYIIYSQILASEADRQEKINRAAGEAEAIIAKARASAESIRQIAQAISENGDSAVNMMVAEKYIQAFEKLAKEGNTILLPSNSGDVSSMVGQAMSIFKTIENKLPQKK